MGFRHLTAEEICILDAQNCFCEDWKKISVSEDFNAKFCRNVQFSGNVKIGKTGVKLERYGVEKYSGIYDAHIHNCEIADGVYISKIGTHIANYKIGENTIIENTAVVEVRKKTTFGNGVRVPVLIETGGRSIPIFAGLSAQFAYMAVFYRHNKNLIQKLEDLAEKTSKFFESDMGNIGKNVKISSVGTISDCNIGDYAKILSTSRLHCGTIVSSKDAPVHIGTGVIADHFIINESSLLLDRAIISRCFVGEGCDLSREYSAENSLFFANFIGRHGEAYAIFAGPHTATHHKSSLLVSGYFLFSNAGSGSNQSNNLYKMGPLHQGIFERGAKTSSDSYVLYPARIGPFTLVLGRHTHHCDTKDMPYSYLIEESDQSILIPGTNLKKIGTIRDADKWEIRNKRKGRSLDLINYDLLNPFSVAKMFNGKEILNKLKTDDIKERIYKYNGTIIHKDSLINGIKYYEKGIVKYLGNTFVKRLLNRQINSVGDLRKFLQSPKTDCNEWFDIAGCLLPKKLVDNFIEDIENGKIDSVENFNAEFAEMNAKYGEHSWEWCVYGIERHYGKPLSEFNKDDLLNFLSEWISVTEELDNYFLKDGEKEYSEIMKIGFGINGDKETAEEDFTEVRGEFGKNEFVGKIYGHLKKKKDLHLQAVEILKKYL